VLNSKINVAYITENCEVLFGYRDDQVVSSRIRFKIQDVMEEAEQWKPIFEAHEFMEDSH